MKAQVLLDRARFYPGAIDGRKGENYQRALSAFAAAQGLPATKELTQEVWDKLQTTSDKPVVTDYTLTDADAAGPYVEKIPPKMEQQADLKDLAYTNPREMLAERFHMGRDLVSALNPGKPLDKAGTTITVAAVDPMTLDKPKAKELPQEPKVERIEVDKSQPRRARLWRRRHVDRLLSGLDRQFREARAEWRHQSEGRRVRPGLHLQPEIRVQGRESAAQVHDPVRAEQSRSVSSGSISPSRATGSTGRRSPRRSARPSPTAASA